MANSTPARVRRSSSSVDTDQRVEEEMANVIEWTTFPSPSTPDRPNVYDMVCVFDRNWYEHEYPDVVMAGIDPATHYREVGYREGRRPNRFFCPVAYRRVNPDLSLYDGDLFLHFIFYGLTEGRRFG